MVYKLTKISEQRLVGVHHSLVAVVRKALVLAEHHATAPFQVLEGLRSDRQCYINFGKGRTVVQCQSGGCPASYSQPHLGKVTWVPRAFDTKHRKQADGTGHAVDLYPGSWTDLTKYDSMSKMMFEAARSLGVHIRWGADWDEDNKIREPGESDNPHFELM